MKLLYAKLSCDSENARCISQLFIIFNRKICRMFWWSKILMYCWYCSNLLNIILNL